MTLSVSARKFERRRSEPGGNHRSACGRAKASHVGQSIKRPGKIDVTVGGFLGKDNQDGFSATVQAELGIANRFQVVQGRTRINVKLTEKDGEVTDFNFSGFEVTPADWERFVTDSLSWLGQFDMVCVSGKLTVRRQPKRSPTG